MGNPDQPGEYSDQPGNPLWEFLHGEQRAKLVAPTPEEAQALLDALDAEDAAAEKKISTVRNRPQGRVQE